MSKDKDKEPKKEGWFDLDEKPKKYKITRWKRRKRGFFDWL